ncbi:MAG: Mrp/NBP35 family ATP-binding protein [Anaerolineae bacterium]
MFRFGKNKQEQPPEPPKSGGASNGGPTHEQVMAALSTVQEPELGRDIVSLKMVENVVINGGKVSLTYVLTTPACPLRDRIRSDVNEALLKVPGVTSVDLQFDSRVPTDNQLFRTINIGARNVVAVASGKGGVGKSTSAVNIAVALAGQGARVGLMDADIYGPNIPMMLGIYDRPYAENNKIIPLEGYGLKVMSMGFLVPPGKALVWRGPMLHGAIRQFLSDVEWGDLDYLIVDMPPGTGDVQLSLTQSIPLTGAVIITTPQAVALDDVIRGVDAFNAVKPPVPVLGVVETMSYFVAPDTGKRYDIFGHGGGQDMAKKLGVPFLGEVPIDPRVREGGDIGQPIVAVNPDAPAAQAYLKIAQQIAAKISVINYTRPPDENTVMAGDIPVMKRK